MKTQDCFQILLYFIVVDMKDRSSGDIFMKIPSSPQVKKV